MPFTKDGSCRTTRYIRLSMYELVMTFQYNFKIAIRENLRVNNLFQSQKSLNEINDLCLRLGRRLNIFDLWLRPLPLGTQRKNILAFLEAIDKVLIDLRRADAGHFALIDI